MQLGALPPLDDDFLAVSLLSAGPVEFTGFGVVGISPQRLESWARITANVISPWQAETILEASAQYAAQMMDKKAPAPWAEGIDKVLTSRAIRAAFRRH